MAAARDSRPTGPPLNFSMIARSSLRSMSSKPALSTPIQASAASAIARVTRPSALIWAKSRTRRRRRLAMRGVPRERRATSAAPDWSVAIFMMRAERATMTSNSSGV